MNLYESIKHLGLPERRMVTPQHDCGGEEDCWWCKIQKQHDDDIADWIEALKGIEVKDGKFIKKGEGK